jgi:DNA transformation protein and related proteins
MAVSEDYAAHVRELLSSLGEVRIKKMFGGAGVYAHDLMFGLIAGETLYLKVDDVTQEEFAAAGSEPFVFEMKGGASIAMRYWRLPDEAADDPQAAERWARLALDAALRARKPKKGARADIGPGPWDG